MSSKDLSSIVVPVVHSNGTGKESLLLQYKNAAMALNDAKTALHAIECHGRDYYVLDNGTVGGANFQKAREQHFAMIAAINEIIEQVHYIYMKIKNPNSNDD